MVKRMFIVTAHWDEEAKVFYSDSDIIGLHIEAATIDEFESVMIDVAPGSVIANHATILRDAGSSAKLQALTCLPHSCPIQQLPDRLHAWKRIL